MHSSGDVTVAPYSGLRQTLQTPFVPFACTVKYRRSAPPPRPFVVVLRRWFPVCRSYDTDLVHTLHVVESIRTQFTFELMRAPHKNMPSVTLVQKGSHTVQTYSPFQNYRRVGFLKYFKFGWNFLTIVFGILLRTAPQLLSL